MEYLEITGKDECVPMAFKTGLLTPGYLAGAVNINTTLRGAAKEQGEKKQTPLAFCFAMGKTNQIIGTGALVEEYYFGSSLCRGPKANTFRNPGGIFTGIHWFSGERTGRLTGSLRSTTQS